MAFPKTDPEEAQSAEAFAGAFDDAVAGTPAPAEPDPATPPAPAEPDPATPPAPAEPDPATPPAPAEPDNAALLARIAELETKVAAPPAPIETPAAPVEPEKFTIPPAFASDEEKQVWEGFKQDYPEVAAMLDKRTGLLEQALMQAMDFIDKKLTPLAAQVAPLAESAVKTEEDKFTATIIGAHADAPQLLPELDKWIQTLPRHHAIGANAVLERGTAQEVVELFDEFKKATNRVAPPAPTPPPAVDSATQDRMQRLEAVPTRRTNTQEPVDPNDFDGAFAQATTA